MTSNKVRKLEPREAAARLNTPTDLSDEAVEQISEALNGLLADTFALYVKTKNFHWHVSGPHFRDYHLLLDEQAGQIEDSVDILAERVRKIGGTTIRSIGHIAKLQRVKDNDEEFVLPGDMLRELMADNKAISRTCARPTSSPTSTRTSPPRACSRFSSTRPRSAAGSCSRPAAAPIAAGISTVCLSRHVSLCYDPASSRSHRSSG